MTFVCWMWLSAWICLPNSEVTAFCWTTKADPEVLIWSSFTISVSEICLIWLLHKYTPVTYNQDLGYIIYHYRVSDDTDQLSASFTSNVQLNDLSNQRGDEDELSSGQSRSFNVIKNLMENNGETIWMYLRPTVSFCCIHYGQWTFPNLVWFRRFWF